MKIFDCFTFFNEIDLLELRLNYLNDYVDYFVIIESDKTHSGQDKPYYFEENIKRFEKFIDKIIHIKKELVYEKGDSFWKLENEQRNAIALGLNIANNDDVIIISDIDEIPSVSSIQRYIRVHHPIPMTLVQINHYYYFNCRVTKPNNKWYGSVIVGKRYMITPQYMRDKRENYNEVKNGGWHFSYLGGVKNIVHKIKSFAHGEFNKPEYIDEERLQEKIDNGNDLFNRNFKYIYFDIEDFKTEYPDFLLGNIDRFSNYIKKIKIEMG